MEDRSKIRPCSEKSEGCAIALGWTKGTSVQANVVGALKTAHGPALVASLLTVLLDIRTFARLTP